LLHTQSECFKCSKCGDRLFSFSKFFDADGRGTPMCMSCNKQQVPTCAKCKKDVSGSYVTSGGSSFHEACFKCDHCQLSLNSNFMQEAGKLYHTACYAKV
jgi:LIM domain